MFTLQRNNNKIHKMENIKKQQVKDNKSSVINNTTDYLYFEVHGAGKIRITKECNVLCCDKEGFSFGVEWGGYGFAGGVLARDDAKKLAEYILNVLK